MSFQENVKNAFLIFEKSIKYVFSNTASNSDIDSQFIEHLWLECRIDRYINITLTSTTLGRVHTSTKAADIAQLSLLNTR